MKGILIVTTLILAAVTGLVFFANGYVNDSAVPVANIAEEGDRVLVVFAHPDDEITVAGTLARLHAQGVSTGIVYLTRGEAGPNGGLVPQHILGEERTREMAAVKELLGLEYLKLLNFPDSGVSGVNADDIKRALLSSLTEYQPSVVIGFDETIGLYGHEDHRLAGLYLHELLREQSLPFVHSYYMVTLPKPMIDAALQVSRMFRERYSRDPAKGLPSADVAVVMSAFGGVKKQVLKAHKTQWEVIDDIQPYGMVLPAALYYRIFDREYYHRVELP